MLPVGYAARAARPDDLGAIVAVLSADDLDDVGEVVFDEPFLRRQWDLADLVLATDTSVVTAPDGTIVAYAQAARIRADRVNAWGVVHPGHRALGLGSDLLARTELRASMQLRERGGILRHAVNGGDGAARSMLASAGFRVSGSGAIMRIGLAPVVDAGREPEGIRISVVEPIEHAEEVHAVLGDAFAGDPDQPSDADEWIADQLADPGFAADLWFLASERGERVGALVGQVWGDRGWIEYVGVRERWRRRGVATALLRRSFVAFAGRGLFDVSLATDPETRAAAVAVYEGVGMRIAKRWTELDREILASG